MPGCHAVQLLIVFLSCNAAFSNPDSDLTYVESDLWFNSRQMLKSWHNLIQWINSYRKWPLIQQRRQMVLNSCKLWQFTYKPLSVLRPVLLTDGTRGLTRKRISELSLCSDETIYYQKKGRDASINNLSFILSIFLFNKKLCDSDVKSQTNLLFCF